MNFNNNSTTLLILLLFSIFSIQGSIAGSVINITAITKPPVYEQQCHQLYSNLTAGKVTFKSIGQQADHLLLITSEDYIFTLPIDNLQPATSTLYLNQSHLNTKLSFDEANHYLPSSIDSIILLDFDSATSSLRLATEDYLHRHWLIFNCSLKNGGDNYTKCTRITTLGSVITDVLMPPYINSPQKDTYYTIISSYSCITKVAANGLIDKPYSTLCLCRFGLSRLDRLLLHDEPCSTIKSVPYPLPHLEKGFTGFISRDHLYLLTNHTVTIIEWPESFNSSTKVVGVTDVALSDFITCAAPPVVVESDFNWKKPYLLYPLLALTFVLLLLSLSYWLFLYYSVKQPTYKVEYLVDDRKDKGKGDNE